MPVAGEMVNQLVPLVEDPMAVNELERLVRLLMRTDCAVGALVPIRPTKRSPVGSTTGPGFVPEAETFNTIVRYSGALGAPASIRICP